MKAEEFFKLLAGLMKDNPPAHADESMVEKLAKIGIVPGKDFNLSTLAPDVARGLQDAPALGWKKILSQTQHAGKMVNGWLVMLKTGDYGTDYLQRAYVAAFGLGANRPQDAIYPFTEVDGEGKRLSGANRYVLHFNKGQVPPVRGFWSLTMYNEEYFFVANPLNRYSISPRNKLKYNEDGSLDLYLQKDSPGKDKESNWLPAPQGNFNLMLRLYWPRKAVLEGSWVPSPVLRVP
jgi:DNA sulfur modification protein DndE